MTIAVRAVVELFRYVKREKELEILAVSISHDHRSVRIYGHYAVIDGPELKYYRHPIRTFDFTEMDGKREVDGVQVHEERLRRLDANAFSKNLLGH